MVVLLIGLLVLVLFVSSLSQNVWAHLWPHQVFRPLPGEGGQRQIWKKLTKKHTQNFESEKLAHKICAKNAQNHAKLAKMPKIAQKKAKPVKKARDGKAYKIGPKTFNETSEKNITAVKN